MKEQGARRAARRHLPPARPHLLTAHLRGRRRWDGAKRQWYVESADHPLYRAYGPLAALEGEDLSTRAPTHPAYPATHFFSTPRAASAPPQHAQPPRREP